jgi:hypothetical protein
MSNFSRMSANRNEVDKWKLDIQKSVDFYNEWFLKYAPKTFRDIRMRTAKEVSAALKLTENLTKLSSALLIEHPEILPMLRMATCPPIARDRLIGLAGISSHLVLSMEQSQAIPPKMAREILEIHLGKIIEILKTLIDFDIFTWLKDSSVPKRSDVQRASMIVADRLCGAVSDPIIRNAQEKRQLEAIGSWLTGHGYQGWVTSDVKDFRKMPQGTYSYRLNVSINQSEEKMVRIPIDVAIMPHVATPSGLPILIEAKSAGDFTNVNKRRKEEATKIAQLRKTYGEEIHFVLFLCGYFDSGYLGYEAAEGIDWVWEHRIDDLEKLGL